MGLLTFTNYINGAILGIKYSRIILEFVVVIQSSYLLPSSKFFVNGILRGHFCGHLKLTIYFLYIQLLNDALTFSVNKRLIVEFGTLLKFLSFYFADKILFFFLSDTPSNFYTSKQPVYINVADTKRIVWFKHASKLTDYVLNSNVRALDKTQYNH